jgi:hypothetical protein
LFAETLFNGESKFNAAEPAADLLDHQPPEPWLHPMRATVEDKHKIKKVNLKVLMIPTQRK